MRAQIAKGEDDISSQWLPPEVLKALAADGAQLLTAAGAVSVVKDAESLSKAVVGLWADPMAAQASVAAGARVLAANCGAVDRVCHTLRSLISRSV